MVVADLTAEAARRGHKYFYFSHDYYEINKIYTNFIHNCTNTFKLKCFFAYSRYGTLAVDAGTKTAVKAIEAARPHVNKGIEKTVAYDFLFFV